jgi:hypothetical protein
VGKRAADVAGADERDLVAGHERILPKAQCGAQGAPSGVKLRLPGSRAGRKPGGTLSERCG